MVKHGEYGKLDDDAGLVQPGTRAFVDNVLIRKTAPLDLAVGMLASRFTKRDCSTSMKANENGIVDNVMVSTSRKVTDSLRSESVMPVFVMSVSPPRLVINLCLGMDRRVRLEGPTTRRICLLLLKV